MKRRVAVMAAVCAVIGVSVGAVGLASLTGKGARSSQIITIPEGYAYPVDARSGDIMSLIMNPDGDQRARCDDAGGTLFHNVHTKIYICTDVDY